MSDSKRHPASFRDPAGYVFEQDGRFYRQVNIVYAQHYDLLKSSGLYDQLVKTGALLHHEEIDQNLTGDREYYKTLLPEQLSFLSYPYEWCLDQWKDAALLTIQLTSAAIEKGMILKDASPFNIQFLHGKPVFIDILSFEKYDASEPWVAYHQFVESFLAPLIIAKYDAPALLRIFQIYPDGIPLELIRTMLPARSKFNLNVLLHVSLPGMVSTKNSTVKNETKRFSKQKLLNILRNLAAFVRSLEDTKKNTSWQTYYEETILSKAYFEEKQKVLEGWLRKIPGRSVLDIGTNTGAFATMAAQLQRSVLAIDTDHTCVNKLYKTCREHGLKNLTPLVIDICNPSPSLGWNNAERTSFLSRAKSDLVLALALIHHLCISKNARFEQLADTFLQLAPWLVVEFAEKSDPRVIQLLSYRKDIFVDYTRDNFEEVFGRYYTIEEIHHLSGTARTLYLMQRK